LAGWLAAPVRPAPAARAGIKVTVPVLDSISASARLVATTATVIAIAAITAFLLILIRSSSFCPAAAGARHRSPVPERGEAGQPARCENFRNAP
jgi:hypothetical protein